MADLSDAELLDRFRAGDETALEALFERYEELIFQFLVALLGDHHLAKDVLQDTFVRALEHLDDVDPGHWRGWLFTVAYRQAMLVRRQDKHVVSMPHPNGFQDPHPGPLYWAAQRDDARRLRELLEKLPFVQREVIRQRIYEGKRFREIADALDCPLNTALARMHEGLKRLRLLWEQEHV